MPYRFEGARLGRKRKDENQVRAVHVRRIRTMFPRYNHIQLLGEVVSILVEQHSKRPTLMNFDMNFLQGLKLEKRQWPYEYARTYGTLFSTGHSQTVLDQPCLSRTWPDS